MFSAATERVKPFTRPLAIVHREFSGKTSAGLATFMVLNEAGWVLTAAHATNHLHQYAKDKATIEEYERLWSTGAKSKALRGKRPKKTALTNALLMWGTEGWKVGDIRVRKHQDLALARVEGFDPAVVSNYPVFRDPADELLQGTSLCRLGYPFSQVGVTYDEAKRHFHLETESIPFFPMDGIFTRRKFLKDETTGETGLFIETSSPGLRGQSGGPVYDVEGRVCGMQSHTDHLPLGFSPKFKEGARTVTEHQYLNVGQATATEAILEFLHDEGVEVQIG